MTALWIYNSANIEISYLKTYIIIWDWLFFRETWKEPFKPRDLIALSAEPFLIYPTHYFGETHYFSDTEWSSLITEGSGQDPGNTQLPTGSQENPSEPGRADNNPFEGHEELWHNTIISIFWNPWTLISIFFVHFDKEWYYLYYKWNVPTMFVI